MHTGDLVAGQRPVRHQLAEVPTMDELIAEIGKLKKENKVPKDGQMLY